MQKDKTKKTITSYAFEAIYRHNSSGRKSKLIDRRQELQIKPHLQVQDEKLLKLKKAKRLESKKNIITCFLLLIILFLSLYHD